MLLAYIIHTEFSAKEYESLCIAQGSFVLFYYFFRWEKIFLFSDAQGVLWITLIRVNGIKMQKISPALWEEQAS